MLNIIGTGNFTVKSVGEIEDQYFNKMRQFILESRNGNSEEYLYFTENQINELIKLLERTKELLN